jgi:CheY-like chemotaxis protein
VTTPLEKHASSSPSQHALLVSDSPEQGTPMAGWMMSQGWTINRANSSHEAIARLTAEKHGLVIVDDTKKCSALATLSHFHQSVVGLTTPVIPFLLETRQSELSILQHCGYSTVPVKPSSREAFLKTIEQNQQTWATPEFQKLRKVCEIAGNLTEPGVQKLAFEILIPLLKNQNMNSVVARILAIIHWQAGKIKEAEKILLAAVRNQPKNPASLIALATFYLRFSQPSLATKLLRKGISTHGSSCLIKYPLAQALILLGQQRDAISILQMLLRDHFQTDETSLALAKLLLAEGYPDESENYLASMSELRGIDLWHTSHTPINAAR